jgi:hypothetical protein
MKRIRELMMRWGGLFNKLAKDRELDEEIESHLQLRASSSSSVSPVYSLAGCPPGARRSSIRFRRFVRSKEFP